MVWISWEISSDGEAAGWDSSSGNPHIGKKQLSQFSGVLAENSSHYLTPILPIPGFIPSWAAPCVPQCLSPSWSSFPSSYSPNCSCKSLGSLFLLRIGKTSANEAIGVFINVVNNYRELSRDDVTASNKTTPEEELGNGLFGSCFHFGIDDPGGFLQPEQFCLSPLSPLVPSCSPHTLDWKGSVPPCAPSPAGE